MEQPGHGGMGTVGNQRSCLMPSRGWYRESVMFGQRRGYLLCVLGMFCP